VPWELIKAADLARPMATNPSTLWRYGFAVVVVLAATGVRLAFNPVLGLEAPHMPFNLAVIIAAWFGGSGPGMVAAALSAVSVDWFFVEPLHSPFIAGREGVWGLALFVITTSLIALLVGSLRGLVLARARAEARLQRQAHLIDLAHDAIITTDSDRRIVTWNNGAEQMYGWSEREAVGKTLHELLQTSGPISITEIDASLRRERQWDGEVSHTARDSQRLAVESRQVLIRDNQNLPASILEINRNVTERKRAELEREGLIAKLQEALEEVKLLSGLLSICASCKKITNERGEWEPLESYLQTHSEAKFSHGVCPDCLRKLYPEQYRKWEQEVQAGTDAGRASDIREARLQNDRTKK
jgi:PAS domain S-box-containing protein